ncbi:MAG: NAD-dependent epimerase/dehydratase family protein [Proteobacteria bacterium]|nr:MAG: NAD-dependent epimerase/dehydratase family protein [Pseudomonadota bacterium]
MRTALITGVSGFIGKRLARKLTGKGWRVIGLSRRDRGTEVRVGDLEHPETLKGVCLGVNTVFHLAGVTHSENEGTPEVDVRHELITREGTRCLLDDAVAHGVGHFVFASSVKAMGEGSEVLIDESSASHPRSVYGRAKLEAEQLVFDTGRKHSMHSTVVRLPLVYGPGNKGNIPRMIAAIDRGRFPPLPKVQNKRSMVHVDDVVRALILAAESPAADGQIYLVTDGHPYSTRELYDAICRELGRPAPNWGVPAWLLRLGAGLGDALRAISRRSTPLTGDTLNKLLGSAWYSNEKIREELGFEPRYSFYDALPEMVREYQLALTPVVATTSRDQ